MNGILLFEQQRTHPYQTTCNTIVSVLPTSSLVLPEANLKNASVQPLLKFIKVIYIKKKKSIMYFLVLIRTRFVQTFW